MWKYSSILLIMDCPCRSVESLVEQFSKKPLCFFILTNSRSLSSEKVECSLRMMLSISVVCNSCFIFAKLWFASSYHIFWHVLLMKSSLLQASTLIKEICRNLCTAAKSVKDTKYTVVLRGDSTLRGHFPEARMETLNY